MLIDPGEEADPPNRRIKAAISPAVKAQAELVRRGKQRMKCWTSARQRKINLQ